MKNMVVLLALALALGNSVVAQSVVAQHATVQKDKDPGKKKYQKHKHKHKHRHMKHTKKHKK